MAEDERERLNKLAELRKSGVLSEEEYHAARARLRARSKSQEIEEVDATALDHEAIGVASVVMLRGVLG